MTKILNKIIDPHLHLFNMQEGDYFWLKPQNPPFWPDKHLINKDFFEADTILSPPNQLAAFVHIEAGFDNQQPWREIDWLEQHCTLPFKSVAFADITGTTFTEHIKQLKQRQSVIGIRHILDEQAVKILNSTLVHQHFALLAEMEFSFDTQLFLADTQAVELLAELANKYNTVRIIINHAGWPPAGSQVHEQKRWQLNMQKLAKYNNIAIKLSGWEMSNKDWQVQHINRVLQDCLSVFGDTRVMLASNFPLCLFSITYADLWKKYAKSLQITARTFEKITYSNAKSWYRF